MPRKSRKNKIKKHKFEAWEVSFMKNGPPGEFDDWKKSPHRWQYFDGRDIWRRLQNDPDFNACDFPWAMQAYKNI